MGNQVLSAGSYSDASAAAADYQAIKDAEAAGDIALVGVAVVRSDEKGKIDVTSEIGSPPLEGAVIGGLAGVAIGLFAPPLLLATAAGTGIGAGIGALVKRHQQNEIGAQVEDFLPPNSSAVIAVSDDNYSARIGQTMAKADKKISHEIPQEDYDNLVKALKDAGIDFSA